MSNIFNKTLLKRFIPILLLHFLFLTQQRCFLSFTKSFILCFILRSEEHTSELQSH